MAVWLRLLLFFFCLSFGVKDSKAFSACSGGLFSRPILDTPMSCEEPGLILLISSSLPELNLVGSCLCFFSSGNFLARLAVGFESSFFSERLWVPSFSFCSLASVESVCSLKAADILASVAVLKIAAPTFKTSLGRLKIPWATELSESLCPSWWSLLTTELATPKCILEPMKLKDSRSGDRSLLFCFFTSTKAS